MGNKTRDNVPWVQTNHSQGHWGCRSHLACSGEHPQTGREKARLQPGTSRGPEVGGAAGGREGGGEGEGSLLGPPWARLHSQAGRGKEAVGPLTHRGEAGYRSGAGEQRSSANTTSRECSRARELSTRSAARRGRPSARWGTCASSPRTSPCTWGRQSGLCEPCPRQAGASHHPQPWRGPWGGAWAHLVLQPVPLRLQG